MDDEVAAVGGDPDAQEHALVGLLVDQHVLAAARGTAEDLGGASVLVAPDPEDPLAVGREDEGPVGAVHHVVEGLAALQVLHPDGVVFRTLLIGGPGVELVVGAVAGRADLEEGLALGKRVFVQQHLFAAVLAAGAARVQRMLGPDLVADIIVPGAVGGRDAGIVLLDATLHLGEQLRLQGLGPGQHGGGVGVLGLEVFADVGAQDLGVAQHLTPVVVLHPGVVVCAGAAELFDDLRIAAGGGGLGSAHPRYMRRAGPALKRPSPQTVACGTRGDLAQRSHGTNCVALFEGAVQLFVCREHASLLSRGVHGLGSCCRADPRDCPA